MEGGRATDLFDVVRGVCILSRGVASALFTDIAGAI